MAGTSSFGMSGVNAHALLQPWWIPGNTENPATHGGLLRLRHWALPPVFHFYDNVLQTRHQRRQQWVYYIDIRKPELSYLNDHQARCQVQQSQLTSNILV